MGICDFCSSPTGEGKRSYYARSQIRLRVEGVGPLTDYIDTGEWVGCNDCAELIDRGEWKALMARAKQVNPGLRAAHDQGKLEECARFVALTWGAIFGQPQESFFEWSN